MVVEIGARLSGYLTEVNSRIEVFSLEESWARIFRARRECSSVTITIDAGRWLAIDLTLWDPQWNGQSIDYSADTDLYDLGSSAGKLIGEGVEADIESICRGLLGGVPIGFYRKSPAVVLPVSGGAIRISKGRILGGHIIRRFASVSAARVDGEWVDHRPLA